MTQISRFSAIYLFFLLLGISGQVGHPHNSPQDHRIQSGTVDHLSPEQRVLALHLAEKYAKPLPLISRIVSSAYIEGARFGLNPLKVLAIVEQESGFRAGVVNGYGAMGLMQVVPRFHRDKVKQGSDDVLLSPEVNIHVGTKILAEYIVAKKGDVPAALKKYSGNAQNYSQKVEKFRLRLSAVAQSSQDRT